MAILGWIDKAFTKIEEVINILNKDLYSGTVLSKTDETNNAC